ncbi:MAG: hypothetical protein IJN81_05125 [Clostridia bacterium]|nr:hypothetical protein [Clostridia bacterium]
MKFFSIIMSFVLSIFGVAPPAQSVDAYTQAEWYALVVEEFDLAYSLEDNDNYDIASDDEYFAVVQACHDNKVIVGEYDADAYVTNVLVAKSLAVAAGLDGAKLSDETALDVAVDAGFVKVSVNLFGKVKEVVITKAEADAALEAASVAYLNKIQAYTQAEWYTLVANEFDLTYDLEDDDNYDIAADDKYFETVQSCYDSNVIVGEYVADAQITNILVAKSLVVAVGLKAPGLSDEVAVNVAVSAGFVNASVNVNGKVEEVVMPKAEANAALKAAGLVYLNTKIPAAQPSYVYTQAEWYALVAKEFNLAYSLDDNDNYDIAADDEYFAVVQACHDNNVIVGEYNADTYVTNVLVAKSLAVAAGLDGAEIPDEGALDVAIDAGFVSISFTIFGKVKEVVISKAEANVALKAAGLVYLNNNTLI